MTTNPPRVKAGGLPPKSKLRIDFENGKIDRVFSAGTVWHDVGAPDGKGYRVINYYGKSTRVHRVIWIEANGPIPDGYVVDHINRDKSDNRLCNLRLLTTSQNGQNSDKPLRNNSSGVRGVSWSKTRNKWRAAIKHDGVSRHIGLYKTLEEAEAAYKAQAIKHHTHHPYLSEQSHA